MKNIHILPTDKPSRLYAYNGELGLAKLIQYGSDSIMNQNIYITSDEEIKEGDWVITPTNDIIQWAKVFQPIGKKIILTTDAYLIKDGVQAIEDEFLEWFVQNPSCEELEVEESNLLNTSRTYLEVEKYKIIIPKEEKLTYSDALKKEERIFNSTMMFKQETIEEVAEKILANNVDGLKDALQDNDLFFFYKGVIQCYGEAMAKWQQEQMYSKEEVIDILMSMPVDSHTNIIEWFQQFKNK